MGGIDGTRSAFGDPRGGWLEGVSERCGSTTKAGAPCRAVPLPGRDYCLFHSPDPADRERLLAQSRRGGQKNRAPIADEAPPPPSLADTQDVATLDLRTPEGLTGFLAAALGALARLPFDARVANAIGQLATGQRALIDTDDVQKRLKALEKALEVLGTRSTLRRVG